MDEIKVTRNSPLIRVLADQAARKSVETDKAEEANEIISELLKEPNKHNLEVVANTVAFTLTDLQQHELDFLNQIADIRNVNPGEKAGFKIKNNNGLRAVFQAKGATTPRSYVAERQFTVDTDELSIRPAINIMDMRAGRVNMADLIREANHEMTLQKIAKIEQVLQASIGNYASPFFDTSIGINKTLLDKQLQYFRSLGQVTILGDMAAVGMLSNVTGMINSGNLERSNNMIDEYNQNGFIGRYVGCPVLVLQNAYRDGQTTPILNDNWLYLIPAGLTADSKNLKLVNEGPVASIENTDLNDRTYEIAQLAVSFYCKVV